MAALVVGCLVPVALASAGGSAAASSSGGWVSTVPTGQTTPSYLTQVDTTDHFDVDPVVALNPGGHGVIAWTDIITGDVVVSEIQPGLAWSAPQTLAQGTRPAVAIDSTGDITVVWVGPGGGVDYGYEAAGSSNFVTGQIAEPGGSQAPGYRPQVVMDSGGNAWAVWSGSARSDGFARPVFGAYLPASTLGSGGAPTWTAGLAFASGTSGSVSLTTSPSGSGVIAAFTAPRKDEIRTFYAPSGSGSFMASAHDAPNPGPGSMDNPAVALSDSGVAVLAWDECGSSDDAPCYSTTPATVDVASTTAAQLEAAGGAAFNAPQTVPIGTPSARYGPRIAANDNEVALAWDDLTGAGRTSHSAVDGATEPLANLSGGDEDWQQLDQSVLTAGGETTVRGALISIDGNSNVTLAWEGDAGAGDSTVNTATASACAASCASVASSQLDSQADAAGSLSLESDPGGDVLLSWTSYAPSGGAIPTVVAGAYDPGPALSDVQIPSTAATGTAASFSVQSTDTWTGLEGPVTTHWDFGDGTTGTGSSVSHTYATPGAYTVTVTADTYAASSTLTRMIDVSASTAGTVSTGSTNAVAKARLSNAASWGSHTGSRSASAALTVPALSCAGNSAHLTGQALGVRLWGSHVTAGHAIALADFAGVNVECRGGSARYRASFRVANVRTDKIAVRNTRLRVRPGDLLQLSVTRRSGRALLSITDLSTPNEAPAVVRGPSLAPYAGWQVGAFPIAGVSGPFPTLPSGFTKVRAGGKGIARLHRLVRSRWHSARVSPVGRRNNQLSVIYGSLPRAPRGGNLAAAAHGTIRYRRPGQHGFANLQGNTPLPGGTLIDATNGTVQLSNAEPHGQNQSFTAWGGDFRVANSSKGATTIRISGTWAPAGAQVAKASSHKKHSKGPSGSLWANAHGNFTTKGNDGAAAVLGTKWLTRNLKHGTLFKVAKDRYDQNDRIRVTVYYPHRHTVVLRQGQSLLAPSPMVKPKTSPFAFTLVGVNEVNGRYNTPAPGYYELVLLSRARPYYVDAAVAPQQPSGGATSFYRDGSSNGEPRWAIHFTLNQSLSTFQLWNVGIQINGKLYVVPLRLK